MESILTHADIFLHVGCSAILAVFSMLFFRGAQRQKALTLTFIFVMSIGVGKEAYDAFFSNNPDDIFSIKDLVSDYAGVALGVLTMS